MKNLVLCSLFFVLFVAASYWWLPEIYHRWIQEDGPIEYLTAWVLLALCVFVFIQIRKTFYKRPKPLILWSTIALGCFLGFGEELSWGQRIFEWESPSFFENHNAQKEINLHNLIWKNVKFNKWFSKGATLAIGAYFLISTLAVRHLAWFNWCKRRWAIPVPQLEHSAILVVAAGAILILPDPKKWELWEACLVLTFFLVLLNQVKPKPHGYGF